MGTDDDKEDHDHDHALELLPVKNTRGPPSNSSDDQKKDNKEQGVAVDLNEYYQQQRDHDHKRKEGEKRNEALHQFHGVAESSLLVQEDHDEQILSAGTNSNAQFETGDSPMNININIGIDIGNNMNTRVVRVRDKKQNENENIQADPALSFQWISTLIASSTIATILNELIRQRSLTSLPLVYHQNTKQNNVLQSLMSAVLMRSYKPSLFIGTRSVLNSTYGYMKPLLGQGSRSGPQHGFFRERMKCSRDGAMIGLDWQLPHKVMNTGTCSQSQSQRKDQQDYVKHGPIQESIVLILHGVNTDTSFGYMRSMMNACADNGWIAVGMNARGCGGVDLNTPRFGTAAYTNDLRYVTRHVAS